MNFIRKDEGAALLSVLLLVSVMSAAMVAAFDLLGFYTKSTTMKLQQHQAVQYALAGEIIGADQAVKLSQNMELASLIYEDIDERKVTFPIESGLVSGRIAEYSNCFNLNSVVTRNNASGYELNQIGYDQYTRLLEGLGIGNRAAIALSGTLVDWQDTDDRPMPAGAESFSYSQLEVPYRAANFPLSDIDELRLVSGYTPDLIETLKSVACVDPVSMETVVNLNSVRPDQAILIHSLLGRPVSIENIMTMIEDRPSDGFDHVSRFWNHAYLKDQNISQNIRKQFVTSPKRYKIFVDVAFADAKIHLESLILLNGDGTYALVDRKLGV